MQYSMRMPKAVYSGEDATKNLTGMLAGVKKVTVITDKGIEAAGLTDHALECIREAGAEIIVIDSIPPEPTYSEVQNVVDSVKKEGSECLIAIGGGSVMDTTKLASIASTDEFGVKELLDNPLLGRKSVRTILIPTTAGTGSEATPNAIVAVPEKELKIGIVNPEMIADEVILDAQMTKNLPLKIAAATGVDALAHCIECYTSNKANTFSNLYAMEGMKLIFKNIEAACLDRDALEAKNKMLIAAFYGGAAITASGTTAVHALSYPLGGKYHIAHGVSNAILLLPVMKFNKDACLPQFAEIHDALEMGDVTADPEVKADRVIERMGEIITNLQIPKSLREFNVSPDDLETLVEAGMQVTRLLNNNRKKVTPEDARRIYQEVLA